MRIASKQKDKWNLQQAGISMAQEVLMEATRESKEFNTMKNQEKRIMQLIDPKQTEEKLILNANSAGAHISHGDV